jgi:hypothetical protein
MRYRTNGFPSTSNHTVELLGVLEDLTPIPSAASPDLVTVWSDFPHPYGSIVSSHAEKLALTDAQVVAVLAHLAELPAATLELSAPPENPVAAVSDSLVSGIPEVGNWLTITDTSVVDGFSETFTFVATPTADNEIGIGVDSPATRTLIAAAFQAHSVLATAVASGPSVIFTARTPGVVGDSLLLSFGFTEGVNDNWMLNSPFGGGLDGTLAAGIGQLAKVTVGGKRYTFRNAWMNPIQWEALTPDVRFNADQGIWQVATLGGGAGVEELTFEPL